MNFIDYSTKQLTQKDIMGEDFSAFIDSYYSLSNAFNNIYDNKESLLNAIKSNIQSTDDEDLHSFAADLKDKISIVSEKLMKELHINSFPDTVLFIGDGTIDGHGLLVNDRAYGFFEVTTLMKTIAFYNLEVFLAHELMHPVHYHINNSFAPNRWLGTEERYFKRMLNEGIATYFSSKVLGVPIKDAYWFGYLGDEELDVWLENCEEMKQNISNRLSLSLKSRKLDQELQLQLFSIVGFENLTKYRLAYYYGTKIVEELNKSYCLEEILKLDYIVLRKCIYSYFNLKDI